MKLHNYLFATYLIFSNIALATEVDWQATSKAIEDYSNLIDIAVSDEPVYDYELRESKDKLLRLLTHEGDKDRVTSIIGRLLDSTHKYKNVESLGKSVVFTINYGCKFLAELNTKYSSDRLLDEYEFWGKHTISYSIKQIAIRISRNNNFDKSRFEDIQCKITNDPRICKNPITPKRNTQEAPKGIILKGGGKICC